MEEVIASPEPPALAPNNPEERLQIAEKIDLHSYPGDHGIKKTFELTCDKETVTIIIAKGLSDQDKITDGPKQTQNK